MEAILIGLLVIVVAYRSLWWLFPGFFSNLERKAQEDQGIIGDVVNIMRWILRNVWKICGVIIVITIVYLLFF
jgi:hypothetical protein